MGEPESVEVEAFTDTEGRTTYFPLLYLEGVIRAMPLDRHRLQQSGIQPVT